MSRAIEIKCAVDSTSFKLTTGIIKRSNFLRNLCEEYESESVIDIPDIKGSIMSLVVEWLQKHSDTEPKLPPQPLRNYDIAEVVGKWEDEFMDKVYNKNFNNLFEFLNAVNFLDIPALLELASAKTACLTKDLTPKEFKELFKIEEDCSEEDLKKIEQEVLNEREIQKEKERQRLEEEENK
jgi:S-phase kinase-associated protein 1